MSYKVFNTYSKLLLQFYIYSLIYTGFSNIYNVYMFVDNNDTGFPLAKMHVDIPT